MKTLDKSIGINKVTTPQKVSYQSEAPRFPLKRKSTLKRNDQSNPPDVS